MRRRIAVISLLAVATSYSAARAATPREEMLKRYRAFQQAVRAGVELMKEKKYDEAMAKLNEAEKLWPRQPAVHYNLACALSLTGKQDAALDALEKSIQFGYVDHEHMQRDPDLEPMRETERFKKLAALAKKKAKGLPPLLHVPLGYDEEGRKAYPLFVVLHGAGGTPGGMFNGAKQILGADKFFVLAPYGSARAGPGYTWNSLDFRKVPAEIDRLKKKYRITKVYLYGFSAGAHVGYVLVLKFRRHFDGFIPMAGALRRQWATEENLKNAKGLPVYAIQGEADRVVPFKAAEQTLALLKKHGAITKIFTHPGAHTAPPKFKQVLLDAIKWIEQQKSSDR